VFVAKLVIEQIGEVEVNDGVIDVLAVFQTSVVPHIDRFVLVRETAIKEVSDRSYSLMITPRQVLLPFFASSTNVIVIVERDDVGHLAVSLAGEIHLHTGRLFFDLK
jgi:hypothetical protein